MANQEELKWALGWALKCVKKNVRTVYVNFGDSKYRCHFCPATPEYSQKNVVHTDACPWNNAVRILEAADGS